MASASGSFSAYPSFIQLRTDCSIAQSDPANNRSLVQTSIYVVISGGGASTSGGSAVSNTNGAIATDSFGNVSWGNGSHIVLNQTVWVSHDANGYLGSVSFAGQAEVNGWGFASNSGTLTGFTNYDRRPATPTFGAITRTVDSVLVNVNATSSPAGTATYTVTRSENGGAYSDSRTGQAVTYSGLTRGTTQRFRATATNTDGTSAAVTSADVAIPNVPDAPTITLSAVSGRALTVSAGVSANNGATVTGYFVQASPDDGATWQTAISIPSRAYRFTDLTGGAIYKFRVFSRNEMGDSANRTSESTFIPSGGRRLTEAGYVSTATAKRLTETGWVELTTAKRLTASGWVDLT